MGDTNIILQYKRETDIWLCTECESENSLAAGCCSVCGKGRTMADNIVKAWSVLDERSAVSYGPGSARRHDTFYLPLSPPPMITPKKKSGNGMLLWGAIFIAIAIIIVLGLIIVNGL